VKILFTGGSGLLASNWVKTILNLGMHHTVISLLHKNHFFIPGAKTHYSNLSNLKEIREVLINFKPDIVIHTAGLTNVELCEKNPSLAQKVNFELTQNIAYCCNDLKIKLVHISTDHMSSGVQALVDETHPLNPLNEYARSKLKAETSVKEILDNALIIRTNFYAWGNNLKQSFSDFIISNLKAKKRIKLFTDVFYTPIIIDELVKVSHELIENNSSGIYNICSNERVTKFEFGMMLCKQFNLDATFIIPSSVEDFKNLVLRPKDMSLSNKKVTNETKHPLLSLSSQLELLKKSMDK